VNIHKHPLLACAASLTLLLGLGAGCNQKLVVAPSDSNRTATFTHTAIALTSTWTHTPTATTTGTQSLSPTFTDTHSPTPTATITVTHTPSCGVMGSAFVHPGAWSSCEELNFVKARISAGAQPWTGELSKLTSSGQANRACYYSSLSVANYVNSCTGDANIAQADAEGAYAEALAWYLTGNATYANRAVTILNAWSALQGFSCGSDQDRLDAGWFGTDFANAAELLRSYSDWSASDISNLQAMFVRAFYPKLNTMSTWNGNVDLTQIDAMMSIAVFCDDTTEFALGVQRLRSRVPSYFYVGPGEAASIPAIGGDGGNVQNFWSAPTTWIAGLQQETCRDWGHHAQFGMGSAIHAAEVAWHQGTDLYTEMQPHFTSALELLATQLSTGTCETCGNHAATVDRYDTWEMGYNHYHNRMGLPLTQTDNLLTTSIRLNATPRCVLNLCFETLTHAEQ
jgi:hypothetical protein